VWESQCRVMVNEHNKRIWDVHHGYVEVWEDKKNEQFWAMQPGSRFVGSGKWTHSVSMWGATEGMRMRKSSEGGATFLHGIDPYERLLVSNNTGILGGLTDRSVMKEILMKIDKIGSVWGFVPRVTEWRDQDGNRRLSWGHPCFVLFQYEEGLENAMVALHENLMRPDGGGHRTLKIEWSTSELIMPVDENEECVESFGKDCSPRFDPGRNKIEDSICSNMYYRFEGAEIELMNTPPTEWLCNAGKSVRKYPGGVKGDEADEDEVDACE
jgi:hypothetical protein